MHPPRGPSAARRRLLIALATIVALLFQGAFAVACGVHDLAHAADTAGVADRDHRNGDAGVDGRVDGENDGWHGLFQAGHGCLQVFGPACASVADLLLAGATHLPSPAPGAGPAAPPGRLLRPPIDA